MRYIDPEFEGIHPLRLELTDDEMQEIMLKIDRNETDSLSLEEIDAATDFLFDIITSKTQTHLGETLLQ